jgi:hypothetical protein
VGSSHLVRQAVDLRRGGGSVVEDEEIMVRVRALDLGNAWAVGRFDALAGHAGLPSAIAGQLPAIAWFSVSATINGGIRGAFQAETRDEESAAALRDVVRGIVALVRLQSEGRPEVQNALRWVELGGAGTTLTLAFDVPLTLLDQLAAPGRTP